MIITYRPPDRKETTQHRVLNTSQVVNGPAVSIFGFGGCIDTNTGHMLQPTSALEILTS